MNGHPNHRTGLQAADEEFALEDHLGGEVVVEGDEELFVVDDLALPGFGIHQQEWSKAARSSDSDLSRPSQRMSSK